MTDAYIKHAVSKGEIEVTPEAGGVGICYRDVALPPGMTRECADDLAGLFNDRYDYNCDKTNYDFAVMAYLAVTGRLLKTESLTPHPSAGLNRSRAE